MKKKNPLSLAVAAAAASVLSAFAAQSQAQISISGTSAITENFDGMTTTNNASLPSFWKMSPAGDASPSYTNVGNFTVVSQAASSGTPVTGGRYNWGNGTTTSDRAIGFITSGGYANPNGIMTQLQNNTANAITGFTLSYDVERYRINLSL